MNAPRLVGCLLAAMVTLLMPLAPTARADEAERLAQADAVISTMRDARKKNDVDVLRKKLEELVGLHDKLEDRKQRRRLQSAAGAILRSEALKSLHPEARNALLALGDPSGAYRQLRVHMPSKKDASLSPDAQALLRTLARRPPDAALSDLKTLAKKGRHVDVRAEAIRTLGGYGSSAKRGAIAKFLCGLLTSVKPASEIALRMEPIQKWRAQVDPLVGALCRLTSQDVRDPAAWQARYEEKKRDLASLFDGSRPLTPPPGTSTPPWKRLRESLGSPQGETRAAVQRALQWLAIHQAPTGVFPAAEFGLWKNGEVQPGARSDGAGLAIYDVGVTGLALHAFLVAGFDGTGKHAFDTAVRRGLRWLRSVQDKEGCFGPHVSSNEPQHNGAGVDGFAVGTVEGGARSTYIYNHAAAALAMVEAYGVTGNPEFRESAQRALAYVEFMQNPWFAWRYGTKPGDNDTSVTSWVVMLVGTARLINAAHARAMHEQPFELNGAAFPGTTAWLDKVTDPDYGRVGYVQRGTGSSRAEAVRRHFPAKWTEAMTAAAMCMRMLMGEDPRKSKLIRLGADLCTKAPPTWLPSHGSIDLVYWHFGTLAQHTVGGKHWDSWNAALQKALLGSQHSAGTAAGLQGSWDPIGAWGRVGGRVYSTALNALTLLTPQRLPMYGR